MKANHETPSILLVDDKMENLLVLEKLLGRLNVRLVKAASGNEALSAALQEEDLVLVLLDVHMPEMDGYEVLEIMYSDEKLKQVPVIFLTAYFTDDDHRMRGYQLGAVDYLYKPIDEVVLLSKVRTFLEVYKKSQEHALLLKRNQLILDSAGEGIFGLDVAGYINFVNPAAAKMFNREPEEILHQSLEILLPKNKKQKKYDWKKTEIYQASSLGYFHRDKDKIFVRKGEEEFPVDYVITSIRDEKDTYFGSVVVFTDATQRIMSEKNQQHLNQAQKMESIGQLTGGLAHDFNNLLMTIQGNIELLGEKIGNTDAKMKKRIEASLAAVQRGASLTQRMLAFARKQALFPTSVDLRENLQNTITLLKPTLGETIQLNLSLAENLSPIWVDPNQLENVIINLAINSRDAMPNGGNIYIEAENIALTETLAIGRYKVLPGDYVKITVTDEGTGIAPEIIEHIFEPFFTTKEQGKGTGLGLSMIYGFIQQSKGQITVYSEVGHGTTFNLYLPQSLGSGAPEKIKIIQEKQPLNGHETILIVEDESSVREIAADYLQELGYQILLAENGKEALETLNKGEKINLLFTDVVMPGGISGPELAEQAKNIVPGLKVLLTSGYPKLALKNNCSMPAIDEHIMKPYKLEVLVQKIREILDK